MQRYRAELENEVVKLQTENQEALRKFDMLDKTNKRRIKTQEEEIKRLKEQIRHFDRLRQGFFASTVQKSREVENLRAGLSDLSAGLETSLLRNESSFMPLGPSPMGSPVHASTPAFTPLKHVVSNPAMATHSTTSTSNTSLTKPK